MFDGLTPEVLDALTDNILRLAGSLGVAFLVVVALWIIGKYGGFTGAGRGRFWAGVVVGVLVGAGGMWMYHYVQH